MTSKYLLILLILLIITALTLWYFFIFKNTNQENYNRQLSINGIQLKIDIANTFIQQYKGLSGRESMCDRCGMLFVFDQVKYQKFSMRGMNFPLGFVFIRRGEVVELIENVDPPQNLEIPKSIKSQEKADQVLEVNAGFIEKNGISAGDTVKID